MSCEKLVVAAGVGVSNSPVRLAGAVKLLLPKPRKAYSALTVQCGRIARSTPPPSIQPQCQLLTPLASNPAPPLGIAPVSVCASARPALPYTSVRLSNGSVQPRRPAKVPIASRKAPQFELMKLPE